MSTGPKPSMHPKRQFKTHQPKKLNLTYSHTRSSVQRQGSKPDKTELSRLANLSKTSSKKQKYEWESGTNHRTGNLSSKRPQAFHPHGSQSPDDKIGRVVRGDKVSETPLPHRGGLEPVLAGTAQHSDPAQYNVIWKSDDSHKAPRI